MQLSGHFLPLTRACRRRRWRDASAPKRTINPRVERVSAACRPAAVAACCGAGRPERRRCLRSKTRGNESSVGELRQQTTPLPSTLPRWTKNGLKILDTGPMIVDHGPELLFYGGPSGTRTPNPRIKSASKRRAVQSRSVPFFVAYQRIRSEEGLVVWRLLEPTGVG